MDALQPFTEPCSVSKCQRSDPDVVYTYTRRLGAWSVWPFYEENAYVPEGGSKRRRVVTPTSISVFNSYDMKGL
jgi:hypothetical protein